MLYAAVSGVSGGHELLTELVGSAIFLVVAAAFGGVLARGCARSRPDL